MLWVVLCTDSIREKMLHNVFGLNMSHYTDPGPPYPHIIPHTKMLETPALWVFREAQWYLQTVTDKLNFSSNVSSRPSSVSELAVVCRNAGPVHRLRGAGLQLYHSAARPQLLSLDGDPAPGDTQRSSHGLDTG